MNPSRKRLILSVSILDETVSLSGFNAALLSPGVKVWSVSSLGFGVKILADAGVDSTADGV